MVEQIAKQHAPNADANTSRRFREADFVERFRSILKDGFPRDALSFLLASAPDMLASSLNQQEKLNHLLYMSRMVQHTGITKYGPAKLQRKGKTLWRCWQQWGRGEPDTFVDVGCGTHDPISLAAYMYSCGFSRGLANDMSPARNPVYSALSLFETLASMNLTPEHYAPDGVDPCQFVERMKEFDIGLLRDGQLDAGRAPLAGKVDYQVCDIVRTDLAENEASMVVSFAVFEHVSNVQDVLEFLYSRTAPGGIGRHFIDLRDHRVYRNTPEFTAFDFLTEEEPPKNLNCLRCSEHISAFEAAGFDILETESVTQALPDHIRNNLIPRFQEMSVDDLEKVAVTLVVRRPV